MEDFLSSCAVILLPRGVEKADKGRTEYFGLVCDQTQQSKQA